MIKNISNDSIQAMVNQLRVAEAKAKNQEANVTSVNKQSEFSNLFTKAINNVNNAHQEVGQLRNRFELGDKSVSLAEVMISAQKASIMTQATIKVRNEMVNAYKEVMSMQI